MERSEPTLVPEWLKNGGSLTGGGTTVHQFVPSSLRSDDHAVSRRARNKSYINSSDHDLGRTSFSDRTTYSCFRRSSSSNGSAHTRSYADRDRSIVGEYRLWDCFDAMECIGLKQSQSMISGKCGETWPRKGASDLSSDRKNNYSNGNGLLGGGSPSNGVHKAAFGRDFPSFSAEERKMAPEIGRLPYPGLSAAIKSLPVSTSAVLGGNRWTSALAEVPVIVGSNGTHALSTRQAVSASSASVASSTVTARNMAEALAQGLVHAQNTPQLSVETRRLEELAIKQSRQLIPMTPSMPKSVVSNTSEKPKPKFWQQQNQTSSPQGLPVTLDVSKSSAGGKLHVLKSAQERNATFPAAKDSLSPMSGSKAVNGPLASSPSVVGSASKSQGNTLALTSVERKSALVMLEKRPTSQSQSRNDFFNLMRKKSMTDSSSAVSVPGPTASPPVLDTPSEAEAAATLQDSDVSFSDISSEDGSTDNRGGFNDNGNTGVESPNNAKNRYSEEEETAFLRSLGWDENGADDGGLTEEEISAFYRDARKYISSRPSSNLCLKGRFAEEKD